MGEILLTKEKKMGYGVVQKIKNIRRAASTALSIVTKGSKPYLT